ncbi:MAG TPA: endonuclease/exonuclease/phosphatase family protein, partial [Planctomycetaceae bacterium]|nr:endonuclease/exonuclease/phosphatase family protein [Planctomycetaceae bacterium]
MKLRLGTFNANNLYRRSKAFQLEGFSTQAAEVLDDLRKLEQLLAKDDYSGATGTGIVKLLEKYDFNKLDVFPEDRWFTINEVRGRLFRVTKPAAPAKPKIELLANGRSDWLGWIELTREDVSSVATDNTARVIKAVAADVLCMVEVEDRHTLDRFNRLTLAKFKASFEHNLLIDGNDPRGIDVGVLSQFEIRSVRSHIDDVTIRGQTSEKIFSRDCPEFEIALPDGRSLWLLANHFKSQGYGTRRGNDAKRTRQAKRVRQLLERFDLTRDLVVVAGDLNDTPDSLPLRPLLTAPFLFDVFQSPLLGGPRWTYHDGRQQIDYLL